MHTETDQATITRTLALWVEPAMARRATWSQRAARVRHALYLAACGTALAMGSIAGHLFGPII